MADSAHRVRLVVHRHLVDEFGCFNCHGPEGSGGVAPYVEKRSGIAVEWAAPSPPPHACQPYSGTLMYGRWQRDVSLDRGGQRFAHG